MGEKIPQVKFVISQMMINVVEKNKPEERDGIHQGEEVPLLSRAVWEGPTKLCRFDHMAVGPVSNSEQ